MTADDMANFHDHMADWCFAQGREAESKSEGLDAGIWSFLQKQHNEAFQYWCRQANPGKGAENT